MHGDDLLDESCAGAWHADDQHRSGIGVAKFRRPRDEFGCAAGNQALHLAENAAESNGAEPRRTVSAASKCCMAKA